MEDLSWWPEHWRQAVLRRSERLAIKPTRIFVAPAMMHLAREILLRADALSAPLHRLRYRWSLRRRAPAWKRRAVRRRPRMLLRATGDWLNTKTGEVTLLHPKTLALCRQHDQQAVIAIETAKLGAA